LTKLASPKACLPTLDAEDFDLVGDGQTDISAGFKALRQRAPIRDDQVQVPTVARDDYRRGCTYRRTESP
jgi:hypothetical protein